MKQRLFSNWTFLRVFYLLMGIWVLVQSILTGQWLGIALGAYFAAMGLFAFGCAAGNCSIGTNRSKKYLQSEEEIDYEEIK